MGVLTINSEIVPLGDTKLVFSKVGYSFDNWLVKDIPYSERVTLPETSLLNSIFKRPGETNISGKKFNKFYSYKYKDNGKIVSSGVVRLFGKNENKEYEMQLLDSSYELFESTKEGKINQIGVDSSDFIFNTTNYDTLKVLNSSLVIWSASSMHEDKTLINNVLSGNLNYSRPYFSVKRILEKMLDNHNWRYSLGINTDFLDRQIISANSEFVFTSYEKSFNTTLTAGIIDPLAPDFVINDTVGATTITLNKKSKFRFRGNADAQNDFVLQVDVTTVDAQIQTFVINKGAFDYDLTTNSFDAGAVVSFQLIGTGSVTLTDFLIYTIIDENDFGDMALGNFIDYKVKCYDNMPDIVQKEMLKHALVPIGGFFNSNNFKKQLDIFSVVSLSKLGAVDLSTKFIAETEESEYIRGYGKINYYEYDVSDIHPSNLGRGTFTIDSDILPDTKTIYKSIFSSSPEVTITDKMIDNTVYGDDGGIDQRINEINPLIGHYEEVLNYTVARFEELNGNNVLVNYYSNFIKAIQNGTIIIAQFNLNKSDYFLFNFKKFVYLQQKESVFYCLGLSDFSENELTEVILLKT